MFIVCRNCSVAKCTNCGKGGVATGDVLTMACAHPPKPYERKNKPFGEYDYAEELAKWKKRIAELPPECPRDVRTYICEPCKADEDERRCPTCGKC